MRRITGQVAVVDPNLACILDTGSENQLEKVMKTDLNSDGITSAGKN
jgi:hypothetical protein